MSKNEELSPQDIQKFLNELLSRLTSRGMTANPYIVGGAAMAYRYGKDYEVRPTTDIDAIYPMTDEVKQEVEKMAIEYGLNKKWFNGAARNYLPYNMQNKQGQGGIEYANPEELIATKLGAGRGQDFKDLAIVADALKITKAQQLVDIADNIWEEGSIFYDIDSPENLRVATEVLCYPIRRRGEQTSKSVAERNGRCARCGRPLSSKNTKGIGSTCERKLYKES